MQTRGLMLVLSAPSGAGKTTICHHLLERNPSLRLSISVTTRSPRPAEQNGVDYYFVDQAHFKQMVLGEELIEHAEVFGNFYGTPRNFVEHTLSQNKDLLFDVDWQGAQKLAEKMPQDVVSVFILPPSLETLEQRLRDRGQDSEEIIAYRMTKAIDEIKQHHRYDFIVINDSLEHTIDQVQAILTSEKQRYHRQDTSFLFQ